MDPAIIVQVIILVLIGLIILYCIICLLSHKLLPHRNTSTPSPPSPPRDDPRRNRPPNFVTSYRGGDWTTLVHPQLGDYAMSDTWPVAMLSAPWHIPPATRRLAPDPVLPPVPDSPWPLPHEPQVLFPIPESPASPPTPQIARLSGIRESILPRWSLRISNWPWWWHKSGESAETLPRYEEGRVPAYQEGMGRSVD